MEAATAERVTFISRAHDQGITIYGGADELRNSRGEVTESAIPAFIVHFEDGRLDSEMIRKQAEAIGVPDVDQAVSDAIAKVRGLPNFNTGTTQGIWEHGYAPDEPKPTKAERTTAIARLVARADLDGLAALIEEERAGHNREDIIHAAQANIDALNEAAREELGEGAD